MSSRGADGTDTAATSKVGWSGNAATVAVSRCAGPLHAAIPVVRDDPGGPRPSTRPLPTEAPDDAVTVAVASRRLGCDPTTVRALLRCRELGGHRVGKGKDPKGVRIHLASIHDYIARHSVGGGSGHDNTGGARPAPAPPPAIGRARCCHG